MVGAQGGGGRDRLLPPSPSPKRDAPPEPPSAGYCRPHRAVAPRRGTQGAGIKWTPTAGAGAAAAAALPTSTGGGGGKAGKGGGGREPHAPAGLPGGCRMHSGARRWLGGQMERRGEYATAGAHAPPLTPPSPTPCDAPCFSPTALPAAVVQGLGKRTPGGWRPGATGQANRRHWQGRRHRWRQRRRQRRGQPRW